MTSKRNRPFKRSARATQGGDEQVPAPLDVEPAASTGDIPPHVRDILADAGERAADRLRDILASPSFPSLPATAQRALIDLALTRAYGLPVRRSVNVEVGADAVAASLASLSAHLPERDAGGRRRFAVIEGNAPEAQVDPAEGDDTGDEDGPS